MAATVIPLNSLPEIHGTKVQAHYEGARPSPQRKFRRDNRSADQLVAQGGEALRNQMRYLERNHDLVEGSINTMVNNIVGSQGITPEFQPLRADGAIHEEYAAALTEGYKAFARRPEVTWEHDMSQCQRLVARSWIRDGEAFAQRLLGPVPMLQHGSLVPYSQELMEADMVPMHYDDGDRIRQGIERNAWGRKVRYFVLKRQPGETLALTADAVKAIPADRMLHVAMRTRLHQLRGVTRFASVITRIEDLKDYEESERIAAKVAARLCAYIKRQTAEGEGYVAPKDDNTDTLIERFFDMAPGMILDNLVPGEDIGIIDSKRPNPNLIFWRNGQLRAFAAGIGASYSSISRDYSGTYSSQRQELVEQWVNYAALTDQFCEMYMRPTVEDFVMAADFSGVIKTPSDVKPGTAANCLFTAPSMPWIDPLKEISAWVLAVQAGFASEYEVMRKRGVSPEELLRQSIDWRKKTKAAGLVFSSDAAVQAAQQVAKKASEEGEGKGQPGEGSAGSDDDEAQAA